ncbi:zinc dependent phospholipase C family protein [Chthonobacter albigriseus]|uniref:zinc dependent phospholipase C family protein n=1 Tax=Chthonobacter albigriseus TaxID=1683161 RepID=UPI0015EF05E6|nr:zinc dependent phospholipase C family protein [Chthonobacter albigriseus]
MFTRGLATCILLVVMLLTPPAHAFKVDVHIWVAQQVLNDLRDGDLEIEIGGIIKTIRISERYRAALRNHPKSFLLGSLGPDAFPDVFSGQMVIHPSVPGGWGTSEWLQHLIRDPSLQGAELAFALGYLTHAAADAFAHTFVNKYAGDVFDLSEHEWAAIRHIHIETFISNYLPRLNNGSGAAQPLHEFIKSDGELNFPSDLILRKFLLNPESIEQLKRSGTAGHLTGVYDLHRSLNGFLAEDGQLFDLEALVLRLLAEAAAGIPIAEELAKEVQRLSNKVNSELNNYAGDLSKFVQNVNTELHKIEGLRNDVIEKGMTETISLAQNLAKLHLDVAAKLVELQRLIDEFNNLPEKVAKEVCRNLPWPLDKLCDVVLELNPARLAKKFLIEQAEKAIADARREIDQLTPKLKDAIREAFDIIEVELQTRIALTNQFIAFVGDKPFGNAFRRHFEIWRDNLPVVMTEWTRANLQAIVNTIDPSKPSITEPLKKWIVCYGGGLFAVPVKATEGICIVWNGVQQFEQELQELEKSLAELTPITQEIFEAKARLERKLEEVKQKVSNVAVSALLQEFDKRANTNTTYIFKGLTQPVGAGELNEVMSRDESGQNLLLIPDAAQRILEEMHIRDGTFDKARFNAVYNAVVLSKLAMLDRTGLVNLSRAAGIKDSVFGPNLYGDEHVASENILFGFLQNIDGNDQWHDLSPPHPRIGGYDKTDFSNRSADVDLRYGYYDRACPRRLGMRMWVDPRARKKLFMALFKGKIAAGIDDPAGLGSGFAPVLDPSYPDLFRGNAWDDDGITLTASAAATVFNLLLEDADPQAASAEISADGEIISVAPYDSNGVMHHTFEIRVGSVATALRVVKKTANGEIISSYVVELGCTGLAKDTLVSEHGFIEVVTADSLWKISKRITGEGSQYSTLFQANSNRIRDQDLIFPGQKLENPWSHPVRLSVL